MARQRPPSLNARIRTKRTRQPGEETDVKEIGPGRLFPAFLGSRPSSPEPHEGAPWLGESVELRDEPTPSAAEAGPPDVLRIPVLADGADPGKTAPSPLAIRDRLAVDRRLVADHAPERLFAYDVSLPAMKHLRGVASPGDRIVFRRGGRVAADRICAVRTPEGIVLARVLFKGRSLLLLPGEGERDFDSVEVDGLKALPGIIAGTHVLLIRR